jgi:hypothetical protein
MSFLRVPRMADSITGSGFERGGSQTLAGFVSIDQAPCFITLKSQVTTFMYQMKIGQVLAH